MLLLIDAGEDRSSHPIEMPCPDVSFFSFLLLRRGKKLILGRRRKLFNKFLMLSLILKVLVCSKCWQIWLGRIR